MKKLLGLIVVVCAALVCGLLALEISDDSVVAQDRDSLGVRVGELFQNAVESERAPSADTGSSGLPSPFPANLISPSLAANLISPSLAATLISPSLAATPQSEEQQLRQRFIQLATSRAEKMTIEELKMAIVEAENHDSEVTARRMLEEATGILNKIEESHPQSEAAKVVGRVKQVLDAPSPELPVDSVEVAAEADLADE